MNIKLRKTSVFEVAYIIFILVLLRYTKIYILQLIEINLLIIPLIVSDYKKKELDLFTIMFHILILEGFLLSVSGRALL